MLSRAQLQLIRSLDSRKGRRATGLFVAEGPKLVGELAGRFACHLLLFSKTWAGADGDRLGHLVALCQPEATDIVRDDELVRASLQQTPQGVLALFRMPSPGDAPAAVDAGALSIALDDVQDPGNLGTIVRMADWFGVRDIWCSPQTADIWNPKAIQATMGGIARVRVHYMDLCSMLRQLPPSTPRYATVLQGESIWQAPLSPAGVIVMGNEGRGISQEVADACTQRLRIPSYPAGAATTESLNVAMATAVTLAEFRRRAVVG